MLRPSVVGSWSVVYYNKVYSLRALQLWVCTDVQPTLTTFTRRAPPRRLYACPFDYQNAQEGAVSTVYVDRKATEKRSVKAKTYQTILPNLERAQSVKSWRNRTTTSATLNVLRDYYSVVPYSALISRTLMLGYIYLYRTRCTYICASCPEL